MKKQPPSRLGTGVLTLITLAVIFWTASLFFDIIPAHLKVLDTSLLAENDIDTCSSLGYSENSYYFHKCLNERTIYNHCVNENDAKLTYYLNNAEHYCQNEAKLRFPHHISAYNEKDFTIDYIADGDNPVETPSPTNVIPQESFSIQIEDKPIYSEESLEELRNTFADLCLTEWEHQRELAPKLLPECEYLLDISG